MNSSIASESGSPPSGLGERLARALGLRLWKNVVATARGRAFLARFLQSTEESDEGAVFDMLVAKVQDPDLHRLVRRHRDDEKRHAEIFGRCVARIGVDPGSIPEELHVVAQLDRQLGGFADAFVAGRLGVMEMYVILLVIEERAVREWPILVEALRPVDPETADAVEGVLRDERRHVNYARAVALRYAPDEATLERTLSHVRQVEQANFLEHGNAFLRTLLDRDLLDVGPLERAGWKLLSALTWARPPAHPLPLPARAA